MSTRKPVADLSGLVATKGQAAPVSARVRSTTSPTDTDTNLPLNFRVSAEFRRRFRTFAVTHDMKLTELLRLAFDEYEKQHG